MTVMAGTCSRCASGDHSSHMASLGGICVGCACPATPVAPPVVKRVDTLRRASTQIRERLAGFINEDTTAPRVDIDRQGTCDACSLSEQHLVASYPEEGNEPWVCAPCAAYTDHVCSWTEPVALALADMFEEFARLDDQGIHPPTSVVTLAKRYLGEAS